MGTHTTNHPIVGAVRWHADREVSGEPIDFLDDFEDRIAEVTLPQLHGVLDGRTGAPNDRFGGTLKFYRDAIPQLKAAFEEIESRGLKDRLLSFEGSFAKRLIKRRHGGPVHTPSNHAFGTAFDINADFNAQGDTPAPIGATGSVRELVPIFENHGFEWGAHFPTPDGMHFEVARLLAPGAFRHPVPVTVFLNSVETSVPGFLIEDQVWLGVRSLVALLGGAVLKAGGTPFTVTIGLNGTNSILAGQEIGSLGYVKAREILPVYSANFRFDGSRRRLDIER